MTRGEGVHTVPSPNGPGWWNKAGRRVLSRHRLKEDAVVAGREAAHRLKVEHTIHRSDGSIGEKSSYGNDPYPPQGSR